MLAFDQYAKVKNKCCIGYFGYSDEYLVQLRVIKPLLERVFPGLRISFSCKDDKIPLLSGCEVIPLSQIKIRRVGFGHFYEVKYNGRTHPIEDLLVEAEVKNFDLGIPRRDRLTNKCLIVTSGSYPTVPLNQEQIQWLKAIAVEAGYDPVVDGDPVAASLVMGVESVPLFNAACQGIATKLLPTGVGARLYKLLFPNGTVLHR